MPHSFHNLLIHAVFSTKDRVACVDAELRSNLFPYMGGILREMGCTARLINGTADHVHLLINLGADLSVSEACAWLKPTHRAGFMKHGRAGAASDGKPDMERSR